MSIMTVRDLEQVQTAFTEAGLDYQLELEYILPFLQFLNTLQVCNRVFVFLTA
ncbi:hypothetical protein [Nostoc sp.]|uniref:hypothetical protein n=1 Tax=Nostoc sp. TaxID=1180 RepID=UPI002FFD3139